MKIKKIEYIDRNQEDVYNLEIEDNNNYYVNSILVSNCHQIKSENNVTKLVKNLNTLLRFGMTGTLPEKQEDIWKIMGIIGPVVQKREISELQDQGYIAKIKILPIKVMHRLKPEFPREDYEDIKKGFHYEWKHIEGIEESNKKLMYLASGLRGNTLVLFDHTEHGKELFRLIDYKTKFFVNGETELEQREDVKVAMENQENVILVANTKCFGTGISIKNVQNIVFTMFGKGVTKIIQAIGRGLRIHERKKSLLLVDTFHNFKYSEDHYKQRKKLYLENYKIDLTSLDIKKIEIEGTTDFTIDE